MSGESIVPILEEIRDQQKIQIANFQRALAQQDEAMALQRRARHIFLFLTFMPWVAMVVMLLLQLFSP
jgi:hypothetical protein